MTRSAVRTAVKTVLAAHFAAYTSDDGPDLSKVKVHRQDGGDEKGRWSVTLGQIPPSDREVRAMRGPGSVVPYKDTFTIPILVEVREARGPEDGDAVTEAIVAELDTALLTPPHTGLPRGQYAPGALEGPNPYRSENGGAYLLSAAVYQLQVTLQN